MINLILSLFLSTYPATCNSAEYGMVKIKNEKQYDIKNVCHKNYLSQYSINYKLPIVVNWTLTKNELSNCNKRNGTFHRDNLMEGKDASPKDYTNTGYDRGHLTPAEDNLFSTETEYDSFNMTNITPQVPELNRNGWKWLENLTRLYAYQYDKVVVYSGVIFTSNLNIKGIRVPDYFWKVIYIPSTKQNISVIVPNKKIQGEDILEYLSTPYEIEIKANIVLPITNKNFMGDDDNIHVKNKDILLSKVCKLQ
ncbi:MAG: DNA/RNA non-specific endonuclease [Caudoviricetes sp.]|nr:MAG: DNA/RNA non-specific endonuclease [Caudoviricetes sp.]